MYLLSKEQIKKKEVETTSAKQEKRIKLNTEIANEINKLNSIKSTSKEEKAKMLNNLAEFSLKINKKITSLNAEVAILEERKRIALEPITSELAKLADEKQALTNLAEEVDKKQLFLDSTYNSNVLIVREVQKQKSELDKRISKNKEEVEKATEKINKMKDIYKEFEEEKTKFEKTKSETEKKLRKELDRVRYEDEKIENDKKLLKIREDNIKKQEINLNSQRMALNNAVAEAKRKGIKL